MFNDEMSSAGSDFDPCLIGDPCCNAVGAGRGSFGEAEICGPLTNLTAEEEMIFYANELPALRPGMRDEFLAGLAGLQRRREQVRNVVVLAVVMLVTGIGLLAFPSGGGQGRVIASSESMPSRPRPNDSLRTPTIILEASQASDSWALVDAYQQVQNIQRARFGIQTAGQVLLNQ